MPKVDAGSWDATFAVAVGLGGGGGGGARLARSLSLQSVDHSPAILRMCGGPLTTIAGRWFSALGLIPIMVGWVDAQAADLPNWTVSSWLDVAIVG